jgi:DNA-directed RNA polymerase II subunit RPB9
MSMKFCRECNNLLYPRENRDLKKLEYACRMCPYVDHSNHNSCVFVNEIIKDSSQSLEVILSDLNKDNTLQRSRTINCPNPRACSSHEAVFFLVSFLCFFIFVRLF